MRKKLLLTIIFWGLLYGASPQSIANKEPLSELYIPKKQYDPLVENILSKVPKNELEDFISVLKDFAEPRGFDWHLILLVMHNESQVNTKEKSGGFGGLIMFGSDARRILKVSMEQLLKMSYIEQAKAAVIIWESAEKMTGIKIDGFEKLQISIFVPYWLKSDGCPYPATASVKQQNNPFCGADGNISKESILSFYRKKVAANGSLKYFLGKI